MEKDEINQATVSATMFLLFGCVYNLRDKDRQSYEHSLRTALMVTETARTLGLNEERVQQAFYAALFHDVGKMEMPDSILKGNTRLTDSEFRKVKEHPSIGCSILEQAVTTANNDKLLAENEQRRKVFDKYCLEISDAVKHHHERWDGKGYPDGLSGEKIPELSRIIFVCDSIDAMLSCRPYARPITETDCREEIDRQAGKMYDTQVVAAVLSDWSHLMEVRKTQINFPS